MSLDDSARTMAIAGLPIVECLWLIAYFGVVLHDRRAPVKLKNLLGGSQLDQTSISQKSNPMVTGYICNDWTSIYESSIYSDTPKSVGGLPSAVTQ